MIELYRNRNAEMLRRATQAMEQLSDEQINWRPNEESNSIGNLVIHLEGNLRHFVESRIGGLAFQRDRDNEFNSRELLTQELAINRLQAAVQRTDAVLANLDPGRLEEMVTWTNDRQVPLRELLLILTTHLGEHVGQILYIAKLHRGAGYQVVSVPHRRG